MIPNRYLLTALLAAGLATSAHAGTVTQTGTVGQTLTDFTSPFTVTGGAGATAFAGFNSALGTLTGVMVTFSVSGTEFGTLANTSNTPESFSFASTSLLSVLDDGGAPGSLLSALTTLELQDPANAYSLAGDSASPIVPVGNAFGAGIASESFTISNAAALAQFIGTNYTLDLNTLTGYTISGGGNNITASLNTVEGGNISIVYDYTTNSTTVPEPSTVAAFAVGLMGLTFLRWRARA